jgi:hypothetical protein
MSVPATLLLTQVVTNPRAMASFAYNKPPKKPKKPRDWKKIRQRAKVVVGTALCVATWPVFLPCQGLNWLSGKVIDGCFWLSDNLTVWAYKQ